MTVGTCVPLHGDPSGSNKLRIFDNNECLHSLWFSNTLGNTKTCHVLITQTVTNMSGSCLTKIVFCLILVLCIPLDIHFNVPRPLDPFPPSLTGQAVFEFVSSQLVRIQICSTLDIDPEIRIRRPQSVRHIAVHFEIFLIEFGAKTRSIRRFVALSLGLEMKVRHTKRRLETMAFCRRPGRQAYCATSLHPRDKPYQRDRLRKDILFYPEHNNSSTQ